LILGVAVGLARRDGVVNKVPVRDGRGLEPGVIGPRDEGSVGQVIKMGMTVAEGNVGVDQSVQAGARFVTGCRHCARGLPCCHLHASPGNSSQETAFVSEVHVGRLVTDPDLQRDVPKAETFGRLILPACRIVWDGTAWTRGCGL
jgi:hypothetical protein